MSNNEHLNRNKQEPNNPDNAQDRNTNRDQGHKNELRNVHEEKKENPDEENPDRASTPPEKNNREQSGRGL